MVSMLTQLERLQRPRTQTLPSGPAQSFAQRLPSKGRRRMHLCRPALSYIDTQPLTTSNGDFARLIIRNRHTSRSSRSQEAANNMVPARTAVRRDLSGPPVADHAECKQHSA